MDATSRFLKFDYGQFNRQNLLRILSRFGTPAKLKILYLSTYRANYTRTESLLALFARAGLHVQTVLVGDAALKYVRATYNLVRYGPGCDLVFVAFRGQEILPALRLLTKKPIVFDAFVSVYDTLCLDRDMCRPNSLAGRLLATYDRLLCRISDVVLVDTRTHQEYFKRRFGASNIEYLYVGCNEELFRPRETSRCHELFAVFWYGTANPLQGVEIILGAAKLLEGEPVQFRLVGPLRQKYGKLLHELDVRSTEFVDFVPYEGLPAEIHAADVCLGGHFSKKDKAARVIAGKTFQFLACGKPTIVGDNPANRELFRDGSLVHFVPMGNRTALAEEIMEIAREWRITGGQPGQGTRRRN